MDGINLSGLNPYKGDTGHDYSDDQIKRCNGGKIVGFGKSSDFSSIDCNLIFLDNGWAMVFDLANSPLAINTKNKIKLAFWKITQKRPENWPDVDYLDYDDPDNNDRFIDQEQIPVPFRSDWGWFVLKENAEKALRKGIRDANDDIKEENKKYSLDNYQVELVSIEATPFELWKYVWLRDEEDTIADLPCRGLSAAVAKARKEAKEND